MRDPFKRIISQYTFSRDADCTDFVARKAKELSFPEFVRYFQNCPLFVKNVYTHHFAALALLDTVGEPDDKELFLNYAKHNVAAFHFVGICEHFSESVRLLCADLGWNSPPRLPHENRSRGDLDISDIDADTMALLLECNRLDVELYEFAKDLFRIQQERSRPATVQRNGDVNYAYEIRQIDLADDNRLMPEDVEDQSLHILTEY